ncbi:MAG TPA: hypothetical protein VM452_11760 [Caulifigura sp.]|jgi:hypothetical protein|nr:hypothetical protein [Caulifigura sp.]
MKTRNLKKSKAWIVSAVACMVLCVSQSPVQAGWRSRQVRRPWFSQPVHVSSQRPGPMDDFKPVEYHPPVHIGYSRW